MSNANGAQATRLSGARRSVARGPSTATADLLAQSYKQDRTWLVGHFRRRGVPHDEADDLAQETILRTLVHLRRHGRKQEDLSPLMRTIARNLLIERIRQTSPVTLSLTDGFDLVDTSPEPAEVMEASERHAALHQAVGSLAPRHRRAVNLWLRGRSPSEIAHELGIKRNAADAILHRARRSLATKLEGKIAGVVAPAFFVRIRAQLRRWAETLGSLDPSGAMAPSAGTLAVMGTMAALSLTTPAGATAGPAANHSLPVSSPVAAEQGAPSGSASGGVAPEAAEVASPPSVAPRNVEVDLENHQGRAGRNLGNGGEKGFLGLEWELQRSDSEEQSATTRTLDRVGAAACSGLATVCGNLSP